MLKSEFISVSHLEVYFNKDLQKNVFILTHPCDLYSLATNFYIVNLEFTGVYIFSYFALKHILCKIYVLSKNKKHMTFFSLLYFE